MLEKYNGDDRKEVTQTNPALGIVGTINLLYTYTVEVDAFSDYLSTSIFISKGYERPIVLKY